jgi:predicted O-linked N-acetylglucosamine transferase (SPINDLY family)
MLTGLEENKDLTSILELIKAKDFEEAEKKLNHLKEIFINNFFLENLHGSIYTYRDEYEKAKEKFKEVIKLQPNFVDGYYNLANIFLKLNNLEEAINFFIKTLDLDKNFYNAYFNLGICYEKFGQIDNSIKNYSLYIQNVPNDLNAYINLGIIFFNQKEFNKAKEFFNHALTIDLASVNANFYIALIFLQEKKNLIAIDFFRKVIYFDKSFYLAYSNLADTLILSTRFSEAIEIYNSFIRLNLGNNEELAASYYKLASLQGNIGDLENAFKNYDIAISYSKNINYIKDYIFHYNFCEKFDPKKYFELINIYLNNLNIKKITLEKNKYQKSNKIRIGFLSADLREHAVGYQVVGILEKLSLDKNFEIYFYNLDKIIDPTDKITLRFKILSTYWFDAIGISAEELAKKIYLDDIEILFDLSGYTANNLLEVFLYKPAPIQISWAGYLASTGIKEIDYIIVDSHVVSDDFGDYFVEKPLVLNDSWSTLTVFEDVATTNEIPFSRNKYLTFGSFNSIYKINKNTVKLWSKILNTLSYSKLKLINFAFNDDKVKKIFKELFYIYGVKEEQLIFLSDVKRNELFHHYNDIDIALDTFPYGGGTTSFEAAWMSVPLLTKIEKSFLSRCGKSINSNLGLNDWICTTDDEYVSKAIKFGNDVNYLKKTKEFLITNKSKNKLFNTDSFAKNLSFTLKKIWHDYNSSL